MSEVKITGFYGHDHEELEGHLRKFQELKHRNYAEAKPFFRSFKYGLQRHIIWEEELIFPLFEAKSGVKEYGPTAVMRHEHVLIKRALEDLHQKVRQHDPDSDVEEQGLLALLAMHNEKEEKILYPAIDEMTTPEEKEQLFKEMQNVPRERYETCGCRHHQ